VPADQARQGDDGEAEQLERRAVAELPHPRLLQHPDRPVQPPDEARKAA
jgi:hypothetical protein